MTVDLHQDDARRFVAWLLDEVVADARGDRFATLDVAPGGRFWLGRLAPEVVVQNRRLGERSERLEPCEVGVRVRPTALDGRSISCSARVVAWSEVSDGDPNAPWRKSAAVEVSASLRAPTSLGAPTAAGRADFEAAFRALGAGGLACQFAAELEHGKDGPELVVSLVNVSPEELAGWDTTIYEAELRTDVGDTLPFTLDNLPDSFRYDRRVPAYGVNGGVEQSAPTTFRTTDLGVHNQRRPEYWDEEISGPPPDFRFETLANNPLPVLRSMIDAAATWGQKMWSENALDARGRADDWDGPMRAQAAVDASEYADEIARMRTGLRLLEQDETLRRAFVLANRSFAEAPAVHHTTWRPFQLGFVLANLASAATAPADPEHQVVDTLWFPTGGGKTETYLLFVVTAAFYDRLRGKRGGITSWGRFPLRMLSLQQTQRFADVLAAAELVRRNEGIRGDPFSLGFFVGQGGTPNRIDPNPGLGQVGPDDAASPRYQVLLRCPFCTRTQIEMRFDRGTWSLDHVCNAPGCPWQAKPIPCRIVDEEIYRFLPTVVLGTLDKAASVSMQAAMRGFYAAPLGRCPRHGYTYAPRSKTPNGCLFPGCREPVQALDQDARLFPPTIRMQDELHLLRDSLGAVDSHYEALLDDLQEKTAEAPKIIASSATLAGHEQQVRALYRREGRTFPLPGPRAGQSFWTQDADQLARRFVGLAPRGVTIEYATDQLCESLQRAVRRLLTDHQVAAEIGVQPGALPSLVWAYGVDVVYGSTLKDVEAASRSFDSQLRLHPLNYATLTGRTPLDEVRETLAELIEPAPNFDDRIHLIAASSMLSHGVDIDRLNIMVMLGLPLATAEFIQTTSRVGRAYPGLVIVLHKIGRERDAAVYRTFPAFVAHADRLIDPVPITARSRRVLELTFAGLVQGRIHGIHEPAALSAGLRQLTTPTTLRRAFSQLPVLEEDELAALVDMLGFDGQLDENLRADLRQYLRNFYRSLNDPATSATFVNQLFSSEPMRSLRDVEEQVPVFSRGATH